MIDSRRNSRAAEAMRLQRWREKQQESERERALVQDDKGNWYDPR